MSIQENNARQRQRGLKRKLAQQTYNAVVSAAELRYAPHAAAGRAQYQPWRDAQIAAIEAAYEQAVAATCPAAWEERRAALAAAEAERDAAIAAADAEYDAWRDQNAAARQAGSKKAQQLQANAAELRAQDTRDFEGAIREGMLPSHWHHWMQEEEMRLYGRSPADVEAERARREPWVRQWLAAHPEHEAALRSPTREAYDAMVAARRT